MLGDVKFVAERREVTVTLEQTQPADHTLFAINIDVLITFAGPGSGAERHTVLLVVPLGEHGVRKETAVAQLPPGTKPVMVQIDPSNKVLFTLEMNPGRLCFLCSRATLARADRISVWPEARPSHPHTLFRRGHARGSPSFWQGRRARATPRGQ